MKNLLGALQSKLGAYDRTGDDYAFECPRCGHGKRKLGVNLRLAVFHCWSCNWAGRTRALLDELGIDPTDLFSETRLEETAPALPTPTEIPGFKQFNIKSPSILEQDLLTMCRKRGGLTPRDVQERGWGISDDSYLFGRLVIPVQIYGKTVQYLARSAYSYVQPKEKIGPTGMGWWPKTGIVYGLDIQRPVKTLILVEGIWDYEAVLRTVPHKPLALMGTQLGDEALGLILSEGPEKIVLLFDGDKAGQAATVKIADKFRKRHFVNIGVAELSPGKDPDDVPEQLPGLIAQAKDYFSWRLSKRLTRSRISSR